MLIKPVYAPHMSKPTLPKRMKVSKIGKRYACGEKEITLSASEMEEKRLKRPNNTTGISPDDHIENEYFCIVSWMPWAIIAKASSQYSYFILLKDTRNTTDQYFRIVAQAVTYEEILSDWNSVTDFVKRKLEIEKEEEAGEQLDHSIVDDEYLVVSNGVDVLKIERWIAELRNQCSLPTEDSYKKKGFDHIQRLKHYRFIKNLGAGSYGSVKLAEDDKTMQKYAVKLIPKSSRAVIDELKEVQILQACCNPFIISIVEVFDRQNYLCIVLELASQGTVTHLLNEQPNNIFPVAMSKKFFFQCLYALDYMHDRNIIHRDMKLDNLLLSSKLDIKITDFGCSAVVENLNERMKDLVGTIFYLAPEVPAKNYLGPPIDVWSTGVCLYNMMTGDHPYVPNGNDLKHYVKMVHSTVPRMPSSVPLTATILIRRMLTVDPDERITIKTLLDHSWLADEQIEFEKQVKENMVSTEAQLEVFKQISQRTQEGLIADIYKKDKWIETTCIDPLTKAFVQGSDIPSDSDISMKTEGIIDYPIDKIEAIKLNCLYGPTQPEAPILIENVDDNTVILYIKMKHEISGIFGTEKGGFTNDYCLLFHSEFISDDKLIVFAKSVEHYACPRQEGIVRGIASICWLVTKKSVTSSELIVLNEISFGCVTESSVIDDLYGNIMQINLEISKILKDMSQDGENALGVLAFENRIERKLSLTGNLIKSNVQDVVGLLRNNLFIDQIKRSTSFLKKRDSNVETGLEEPKHERRRSSTTSSNTTYHSSSTSANLK